MGGVGSGNWHRLDKKTTTDECCSLDVRRFHREGLLQDEYWQDGVFHDEALYALLRREYLSTPQDSF